jgi:hypothetical protein
VRFFTYGVEAVVLKQVLDLLVVVAGRIPHS